MRNYLIMIGLVSIVSCTAIPQFPEIDCKPAPELTKKELKTLSECKKDQICQIPYDILKKIYTRFQMKSECLEKYQGTAKTFQ